MMFAKIAFFKNVPKIDGTLSQRWPAKVGLACASVQSHQIIPRLHTPYKGVDEDTDRKQDFQST